MPTIGRAEIDVSYDGDDLPRQARALGERVGEAQADAIGEELEKGQKETNDRLGKEAEKAGKEQGNKHGIAYADAQDKVLKQRTQKLADEIARTFADDDGVKKFADNYKGAGDATDVLREKVENLRKEHVLTGDQYDELTGHIDKYAEQMRVVTNEVNDQKDAHVKAYEQMRRDLDADDRARVKWSDDAALAHRKITDSINEMADESTRRIDEATDRQAAAYDKKFGPAIDRAAAHIRGLRDDVDKANGVNFEGSGLSRFFDRIDDFASTSGGRLQATGKGLREVGESVEDFGKRVDRSGADVERRRGAFSGFKSALDDVVKVGGGIGGAAANLLHLGESAAKAGDGGEKGGKGIAALNGPLRVLSQFDPFDNPGQLFLLIVALAPQVAVLANAAGGGILILAGALTALGAAGVGYGVAFSNLFGDLNKLDPAIRPAAKALQDLKGDFDDLRLNLQKQIFTPAVVQQFQNFGNQAFDALNTAFSRIGPALSQVLEGVSRDLNSSGFKKDLTGLFDGLEPSIRNLGGILRNTFGIIGELLTQATPYVNRFTGELDVATGKFLAFLKTPEGKTAVKDFLDNATRTLKDVGDAAVVAGGALLKLVTPKNVERTGEILKAIGDAAPGLTAAADALGDFAGAFAEASKIPKEAGQIGQFFEDLFTNIDTAAAGFTSFFKGIGAAIDIFVASIGHKIQGIGTAFDQLAHGDIAGAGQTIKATLDQVGRDSSDFANALDSALNVNAGASFRLLDQHAQSALTALATRFAIPRSQTTEFGGDIARLADSAGVDISRIANAKGWGEIQAITGATGTTIDRLKAKYGELPDVKTTKVEAIGAAAADAEVKALKDRISTLADKVVNVKADGPKPSFKDVSDLSTSIGALVGKTVNVQTDKTKPSTADVGALGASIGALVGKTVNVKEDGSVSSKGRVGDLTGSINNLKGKTVDVHEDGAKQSDGRVAGLIGQIGALKGKTVGVAEDGSVASKGRVGDLMGQIRALTGKTVNVSANVSGAAAVGALAGAIAGVQSKTVTVTSIARSSTQNRFGGIMAGGQQIAGGEMMAFAKGGILNRPTFFGNVLAGEAGAEAIVPLTGALSSVDSSVRDLAAYARGRQSGGGGGNGRYLNVAKGAVQVISNNANPEQVASAALDRLAIRAGL